MSAATAFWALYKGAAVIMEAAEGEAARMVAEGSVDPEKINPFALFEQYVQSAKDVSDRKGIVYEEQFFVDARAVGGMSLRLAIDNLPDPKGPEQVLKYARLNLEIQASRVESETDSWTLGKVH